LRRPPSRFGRGILPSFTISSNVVGDTLMYAAAAARLMSRGANVGGNAFWWATGAV
jgi:hypothetical protein